MSIICGAGRLFNKVARGDGREGGFRKDERSYNVNCGKEKRVHCGERLGLDLLQKHRCISHRFPRGGKESKTVVYRFKLLSSRFWMIYKRAGGFSIPISL